MPKCSAPGCASNDKTEVNGRTLTLFPFPAYDDLLSRKWEQNSKVYHTMDQKLNDLKLCELHFDSTCFVIGKRNVLMPNAIPTIFDNNKRRLNGKEKSDSIENSSPKQRRLQSQQNVTLRSKLNPLSPPASKALENNMKAEGKFLQPSLIEQVQNNINKTGSSSVFTKQIDMGKKVYRLIIRIDKVCEDQTVQQEPVKVVKKGRPASKVKQVPELEMPEAEASLELAKIEEITSRGLKEMEETPSRGLGMIEETMLRGLGTIKETNTKKSDTVEEQESTGSKIIETVVSKRLEMKERKTSRGLGTVEAKASKGLEVVLANPSKGSEKTVEAKVPRGSGTAEVEPLSRNLGIAETKVSSGLGTINAKASRSLGTVEGMAFTSLEPLERNNSEVNPCLKTGCKLKKTILHSKPVFQCERCNKYYVVKENAKSANAWACYICQESMPNAELLGYHIKKHFNCDICQLQCMTQLSFDKHRKHHVSTDPLLPYKCHKCSSTFEVKADVRQHCADKHSKNQKREAMTEERTEKEVEAKQTSSGQVSFQCEYCYVSFKTEQAYKSHVHLHMGNSGYECGVCCKNFQTTKHLAAHQARHSEPVKASKGLSIIQNRQPKTRTIAVAKENPQKQQSPHPCTICNKILESESALDIHIRGHLSNARRCPLCHKAFINKTTLGIHFKTHKKAVPSPMEKKLGENRIYNCTLCPERFDKRSQLYNHIMTHLEQIHGEGEEPVFDSLDQLLESDEDLV
ncbi:zinc finger protein 652-like isoform X1 [Neodiprion fabricii]|uniref:zinc finger protein 652-like isoform X1 n=1 Tax=Neodiprion fabricii TaxID=2872261 RepID=UPI001ED92369|nr:zinc finger protein 652-like isoform X1 [Neodiprion fabricii]